MNSDGVTACVNSAGFLAYVNRAGFAASGNFARSLRREVADPPGRGGVGTRCVGLEILFPAVGTVKLRLDPRERGGQGLQLHRGGLDGGLVAGARMPGPSFGRTRNDCLEILETFAGTVRLKLHSRGRGGRGLRHDGRGEGG